MKKQIIINNIKKYNVYKNSCDVSNNTKSLYNNVIKETKKTYIELQQQIDASSNILELYDNYDKQLGCIVNIQNIESYQKQHILQALKKKLASYKQQDIKKGYHDSADNADYADYADRSAAQAADHAIKAVKKHYNLNESINEIK